MRRRDLSHEELAKVIRLRQENATWLKIQREIGIPRRIAQRAHEQYVRSQAREELKAARKEVAAEEFRTHLNLLTGFAESIVLTICIPSLPNETRYAKEVLGMLSLRDRLNEVDSIPAIDPTERGERRASYQNRMLFDSLQAHTCEKVRWQALDEWKDTWDRCREDLIKLREEANEILSNILKQKPKLIDRIMKESGEKNAMEQMVKGVLYIVWCATVDQESLLVQALPSGDRQTVVTFGRLAGSGLIFTEVDLAEEVVEVCKWAVKNLDKVNTTSVVAEHINIMKERIKELEEMLDPLMLRPLILGTRCDLCPV